MDRCKDLPTAPAGVELDQLDGLQVEILDQIAKGRAVDIQGIGVWGATEQKVHLSPASARKPLCRLVSPGKPSFFRTWAGA